MGCFQTPGLSKRCAVPKDVVWHNKAASVHSRKVHAEGELLDERREYSQEIPSDIQPLGASWIRSGTLARTGAGAEHFAG